MRPAQTLLNFGAVLAILAAFCSAHSEQVTQTASSPVVNHPADKESSSVNGPDFSNIDSLDKAVELFKQGKLEKLYLMPLQYGGADIPQNVVYVPVGIAALKNSTDVNVVGKLLEEGKITQYNAQPKYSGNSFIPIAIEITATNPGSFTYNLAIWGGGLKNAE